MLLLALFVKPLFARGEDGLFSIRPRHRRTVFRNVACTVGVVVAQLAETVVVYTVVYHKGSTEEVREVLCVCGMGLFVVRQNKRRLFTSSAVGMNERFSKMTARFPCTCE